MLARPGYLPFEETYRIEAGRPGQKLVYRASLTPEPDMGFLEVKTFPPRAQVTIGGETRDSPARWRLPTGPVHVSVALEDFEPQELTFDVRKSSEERPNRLQLRLRYNGPAESETVGRLIIYRPGEPAAPGVREVDPAASRISSFFNQTDTDAGLDEWDLPPPPAPRSAEPEVLAERPVRRGVILIGRDDPSAEVRPDVRLFDAENSVTRGCHAWLWIYADRSTGADYNTFLVGNNSPAGIRVDGSLVMESRRLSDDSVIEIGNFRLRVVKETPSARVELDF
jgi:hypothetical protein